MSASLFAKRVLPALSAFAIVCATATAVTMTASPAMALCKYGTPHCVNPNPGPQLPKVGGVSIPPSDWHDPECGYYGNCNTTQALTKGGVTSGLRLGAGKIYTR